MIFQKRFKRLKRIQAEESDDEQEAEQGHERDAVATELFEGSDNVSIYVEDFPVSLFFYSDCAAALLDFLNMPIPNLRVF